MSTERQAIATKEVAGQVEPISESAAIIQLIERAASDPRVDIDKMERILQMRREVAAEHAETAFNEAMTLAQTEMHPVSADATNPQTKSRYASYAALDRVLRPIYTKHGFALSFDTGEGAPEGCVRVVCYVSRGGHTRTYRVDMPADGKGAKGGDVMTKTHAAGSAFTYAARYLLKMIFNVAVGNDDDDGNAAGTKPITDEQVAALQRLIVEIGADLPKVLAKFRVERLNDLPANQFDRAVNALNEWAKRAGAKQ